MVRQGETYIANINCSDEGLPEDLDEISITIKDPDSIEMVTEAPVIRDGIGVYHYPYSFSAAAKTGLWTINWNLVLDGESFTINKSVELVSFIDLCTLSQVKQESAGRIKDNTLDNDIEYKITDLSDKLLEKYPTLTSTDRTARKCCIYGVLAWLVLNKRIKENKQISSFKDGNFSANYTNNNTEDDNESIECKTYKKLLRQLMPTPPIGANTRGRYP